MASNRINYNDSLPAPPVGRENVHWQADATVDPANVSANVAIGSELINAQTGTSYTFLASDLAKLVTHSNVSATADTLPQATGDFGAGWFVDVRNIGAGTVTITPITSTINGSATLTLSTGHSVRIVSDGTDYQITNLVDAAGGTVTSVALTVPSWLSVAGSPVTGSGTLAVTATSGETANQVLATPDGTTGAIGLRMLVAADLPAQPVLLPVSLVGMPAAAATVFLFTSDRTITFAGNFSGSAGTVGTNPTATATYTVKKNGSSIGTIVVSTGGVVTFTTTSGASQSLASGDRLTVIAPTSQDATLADAAITLTGTR